MYMESNTGPVVQLSVPGNSWKQEAGEDPSPGVSYYTLPLPVTARIKYRNLDFCYICIANGHRAIAVCDRSVV
jgi:hypothetical protein